MAPWASTASSSGSGGPRPPVFGPPADEDEQSTQFSMVGCRRVIDWDTERQRLVHELDMVETKEEADELDRKINALTAQLDEDDARYAPGAEQARTRRRLEIKLEESKIETIEIKEEPNSEEDEAILASSEDEEGAALLAQASIPILRATSTNTGKAEGERKSEILLCVPSRPRVQGWRPVSLPAHHQGVAVCAERTAAPTGMCLR